ncbi:hypothetical protein H4Q26_014499 [Puccinia striiformis f. sp. tritici PST-130]|nr:hypothetical protein H4Q26_014499 [Puccinia striiformis f. sp. tritici PST-130]
MFHRAQLLSVLLASTALCRSLGQLQGPSSSLYERSLPSFDEAYYSLLEKRGSRQRQSTAEGERGRERDRHQEEDQKDVGKEQDNPKDVGKEKEDEKDKGKDANKGGDADPNGDPKKKEKGSKSTDEEKAKKLADKIENNKRKQVNPKELGPDEDPNANGQKSGIDPKDVGLSSNPNGEEAPNGKRRHDSTPPIKDATPPPTKDNTPAPVTPPTPPTLSHPHPLTWPLSPSLPPEVFDMPKT